MQATNIVLADGASTPLNVTFSPEQVSPQLSVFTDRSPGIANAFRRLKVSNTFAAGKSVVNRSKYSIEYPVLQTVGGVQTVTHVLRGDVGLIWPDISTDADRKNAYAFLVNGLTNSLLRAALRDLDPLY